MQEENMQEKGVEEPKLKSKGTTIMFLTYLGLLGAHHYYTGKTKLGILYTITIGFLGMGVIYDFYSIINNQYIDGNGNKLNNDMETRIVKIVAVTYTILYVVIMTSPITLGLVGASNRVIGISGDVTKNQKDRIAEQEKHIDELNKIIYRLELELLDKNETLDGIESGVVEEVEALEEFRMTQAIIDEAEDVNYMLMWEDYKENEKLYTGKYIRISGRVSSINLDKYGKRIKTINFKEGLTGITGMITVDMIDLNGYTIKEDDYVTIIAKADSKIMGLLYLKNGYIEDSGKTAEERVADSRQELKDNANRIEQEAIQAEKDRINNLIKEAVYIDYTELIRNPYKHVGSAVKAKGEVVQEILGGIINESGYRIKDGNNEWYITYKIKEGESRIIVGDTVEFYGEFLGLRKMKRAFTGVTDLVPNLKAEIHK